MTDEVTGITPPGGPGDGAAYGLAGTAATGRGAWPPPERGPAPPPARRSASLPPGHPGPSAYPEPAVRPQRQAAPGSPPVPPRGARSRRSGSGRGAQVPYAIVVAGLAAGLAYIWQGPHSVRAGTFILAGALFVAVTARLALPERRAGMLASRRRYIDVTALAILAIGLLVAGLVLPTPS